MAPDKPQNHFLGFCTYLPSTRSLHPHSRRRCRRRILPCRQGGLGSDVSGSSTGTTCTRATRSRPVVLPGLGTGHQSWCGGRRLCLGHSPGDHERGTSYYSNEKSTEKIRCHEDSRIKHMMQYDPCRSPSSPKTTDDSHRQSEYEGSGPLPRCSTPR